MDRPGSLQLVGMLLVVGSWLVLLLAISSWIWEKGGSERPNAFVDDFFVLCWAALPSEVEIIWGTPQFGSTPGVTHSQGERRTIYGGSKANT